ncbi:MAG: ABC transporter permease [Candidatus Caldatribacteriota bacterium]|nr:ABC transporter permease [Candidatus Caldatribacteriota bacterium]
MRWKNIKLIFIKELMGTVRDKRTIIAMIIIPLIFYPLLFAGIGYFSKLGSIRSEEATSKIIVCGEEFAPQLVKHLQNHEKIEILTKENDSRSKLQNGDIQALLVIPADFKYKIEQEESIKLLLKYDTTEIKSRISQKRISQVIEEYKNEIILQRLSRKDLKEEFLSPVILQEENIATTEKVAGSFLSVLLPYLIIILIFAGAMHTAVDITAGEKERGTIATLLVSQISRLEIVLGKSFAVMLISFTSMILGLVGLTLAFLSGASIAGGVEGMNFGIPINTVFLLFLVLFPMVGLASALLVMVGIFARNIREASSYITPIYMLTIFLGIISISQGMELTDKMFLVPVLNSSFVFKEILMGKIYWSHILTTFSSNIIIAGITLYGAVRLFNKEEVLFRS